MSAGTLKLVNGFKTVIGNGTDFSSDVWPADFIVVTVGGVTYSLVVASVQSATQLTLLEGFDGPSVDAAAWTAVPYGAQMRITQQLGTDISRLMRYYLMDKNNWNSVLTGPDDVTVTLPDGTQYTGPSWPKVVALVAAGYRNRGNLNSSTDLNTLGPDSTGIWVQNADTSATTALHYPEKKGGTLEVLPHRQGAMQRYTSQSGKVYVRTPSGAWDGSSGPWSDWITRVDALTSLPKGGTVDQNDAALTAAGKAVLFVPAGTYRTSKDAGTLPGLYWGEGQIVGSDGNKRGRIFSAITEAPASRGDESSVLTAFNGDNSKSPMQIECRITGENTLGKPATGYVYQQESMANYTYLYNSSGWNQSLAGNGGRTGIAAYRAKVDQYGQGDAVAFNASVFIASTKPGATHFLANPAGVGFNLDMGAGADGVYFNPLEFIMHDNGKDVACVGFVSNYNRTNGTGAKSAIWHGSRYQSVGTVACNAIISAGGKWNSGLDFSQGTLDFGGNQAAISLKANQRIYFNNNANAAGPTEADWHTTGFNGDYMTYTSGALRFYAAGSQALAVDTTGITMPGRLKLTSTGNVVSSAVGGSADAIPSKPFTYLKINIDGTEYKIPVFQ